ncbi:MAG TPA: ATP-binding cassette domain-containing protein [Acidimicrobiales bacterium]|jgi:ABC-2 type transport system ATP-binding protein|nr:ATP-binding cassette domain-containing protein [Acidimicrobiales bacterium]
MRAVVADGVVVRYGEVEAVRHASFAVESGEVFGLLGPNGAGKTSVLRVLTTLVRAAGGHAWVLGHEVGGEPALVRRLIGYVPQAVSADGSLSGRENALLFARLYNLPRAQRRARVDEVLDQMGLGDAAGRLARTYSGGMLRRLEIACGLLHRPRVLFLDEPTVGLDPAARRTVWEHLHELREASGTTLVVTTHAMEEAEEHCARVAVMAAGRVLAQGSLAELRAASGRPGGSLETVFLHLVAGGGEDPRGGMREIARRRRTARRLG